jgi:hypothetical protein
MIAEKTVEIRLANPTEQVLATMNFVRTTAIFWKRIGLASACIGKPIEPHITSEMDCSVSLVNALIQDLNGIAYTMTDFTTGEMEVIKLWQWRHISDDNMTHTWAIESVLHGMGESVIDSTYLDEIPQLNCTNMKSPSQSVAMS